MWICYLCNCDVFCDSFQHVNETHKGMWVLSFQIQVRLKGEWTPWLGLVLHLRCDIWCISGCMTCGEIESVGSHCCNISQHINSTIEECCVKTKVRKSMFPLLCLTAELRERDEDVEKGHKEERQDTLIQRGLVLTSLWEALFSLPWKESMWLILEAISSPCSLTSFLCLHENKQSKANLCSFGKL